MPKYNGERKELADEDGDIRRGDCSSSSSMPAILKNFRIKRAILVAKRGGTTTPVPEWKVNASPCSVAGLSAASHCQPSKGHASISARKLASALWELNELPSLVKLENLEEKELMKEKIKRNRTSRFYKHGSLPQNLSDPSHSPASESSGSSKFSIHGQILPLPYHKFGGKDQKHMTSHSLNKSNLMEIEAHSRCSNSRSSLIGDKNYLKDLEHSLATSKELLKILIRSWAPRRQHASTVALASALCAQVDESHLQIDRLIQEQRSENRRISCLQKKFHEENDSWRFKEQERINASAQSIMKELDTERKLRRRAERLNKKLGMELAQTRTSLLKTTDELESERRTREVIEQVYNEMVRNIGQEKADVEMLKRESFTMREELEKEKEMLLLANEWREERIHMKLSEAKLQFEEKNAAVDQLRNELETFLAAKRTELNSGLTEMMHGEGKREIVDSENKLDDITTIAQGAEGQGDTETDSEESDLHSIELNINNIEYNWTHSSVAIEEKDEVLPDKESHERMNTHNLLDANKIASENTVEVLGGKLNRNGGSFQHLDCKLDEGELPFNKKLLEYKVWKLDESMKASSANDSGDQALFGSRIVFPHSLLSPTRQWNRQQALQNVDTQPCEGSKVAEMLKAIRESESTAKLIMNRNEVHSQLQLASLH